MDNQAATEAATNTLFLIENSGLGLVLVLAFLMLTGVMLSAEARKS